MNQSILFVDDEPNVLKSYERMLRGYDWQMTFERNATEGIARLLHAPADLVIVDMRMPGMSGLEFLERMQRTPALADIPAVMVTGEADRQLKRKALDLGAADLLNKPIEVEDLVARIRSALKSKWQSDSLRAHAEKLERVARERTSSLAQANLSVVWRLAKTAEYRDDETGNHVVRVGCYSQRVASAMGLDRSFVDAIFLAAPLHDIGKIGIPDSILRKPAKLSAEEIATMRRHCQIGEAILTDNARMAKLWLSMDASGRAASALVSDKPGCRYFEEGEGNATRWVSDFDSNPVLAMAASIARSHHEQWNGTGYPEGRCATETPIEARIVAICDVFDALRSHRPYKPAYSLDRTFDILRQGRGSHFDPEVYDAFAIAAEEILRCEQLLVDDAAVPARSENQHETRLVC